jgi:hypothetical protein
MSCYFRHMKDVMEEVGIEITPDNKKEIDVILHGIVDVEYKNCSPAWKKIKEMVKGDPAEREKFVEKLKEVLEG